MAGSKRSRKSTAGASSSRRTEEEPNWGKAKRLSEVRASWQPILYKRRLLKNSKPYMYERSVLASDWECYGVLEPFRRLGWMAALQPIQSVIWAGEDMEERVYPEAVKEWMATLVKQEGTNPPLTTTLTGTVADKEVVLDMGTFNNLAGPNVFDSGIDEQNREYPSAYALFECGLNSERWISMMKDLFQVKGDIETFVLEKKYLKPLARCLLTIMNANILPRSSDRLAVRNYEVPILHALVKGRPALSLRHVMMTHIWESRETKSGTATIPYVRFISMLLIKEGAIPGTARPRTEKIKPIRPKVGGLSFMKVGNTYMMQDVAKRMKYRPGIN